MGLDVLDFDRADPVALERRGDLLLGPTAPSGGFAQRLLEGRPLEQQAILRSSHRFSSAVSYPQPKHRRPADASYLIPWCGAAKTCLVDQSSVATATERRAGRPASPRVVVFVRNRFSPLSERASPATRLCRRARLSRCVPRAACARGERGSRR